VTRTILVTGGTGQVGNALGRLDWPEGVELHAPTRAELDLADPVSVQAAFAGRDYAAVISCGAYTAVDRAEDDLVAAFAANAMGPAVLAAATAAAGVPIVHVSTDYVFDGTAPGFYREDAPVAPLGVYGASKLAGELAVASGNPRHVILRTAWVLSDHGSNFAKTMLRVGATHPSVRVVDDQHGCPTAAADIADALQTITLRLIEDQHAPTGRFHFVNAGEATWCELARFIFAEAARHGGPSPAIEGIATADYPTRARRPANSRLDTAAITAAFGIVPRPWQEAVAAVVAALAPQYRKQTP
jgi:dTDP-4-dehydrorhamnose reductase